MTGVQTCALPILYCERSTFTCLRFAQRAKIFALETPRELVIAAVTGGDPKANSTG